LGLNRSIVSRICLVPYVFILPSIILTLELRHHFFHYVAKIATVGSGLRHRTKFHMDSLPKPILSHSWIRDRKKRGSNPGGGRYCDYAMAVSPPRIHDFYYPPQPGPHGLWALARCRQPLLTHSLPIRPVIAKGLTPAPCWTLTSRSTCKVKLVTPARHDGEEISVRMKASFFPLRGKDRYSRLRTTASN
jgi:hypothetical protein